MVYIISLIVMAVVLALDLITKHFAELKSFDFVVIPELLKFELTHNTGAAFSFLGNSKWAMPLFITLTIVVLLAILGYFIFCIVKKRKLSKWFAVALSMSFAGALGNMIDRIAFGEVRDFIYVFYNTDIFPAIFNVADMALVVGLIMVVIYFLFLDKEAVFKKGKNKKKEEDAENKG